MWDPYADFTKVVLPNGLTLYHTYWDRPWEAVRFIVHAGAREDPKGKDGLAHLVEHCVSENVEDYPNEKISQFFHAAGGRVQLGSTSYLDTTYQFMIPLQDSLLEQALEIFGRMLITANLTKHLEREREVVTREFYRAYPFRESADWDAASKQALFRGHRLESYVRPLGVPESFMNLKKRSLQTFYDTYYVPTNISVVVVGGRELKAFKRSLSASSFGASKPGFRNPIHPSYNQFQVPAEKLRVVRGLDFMKAQLHAVDYRTSAPLPAAVCGEKLWVYRQCLNDILNEEVRLKRGWSYNFSTRLSFYQDVAELSLGGSLSPDGFSLIESILDKCINEVPKRQDIFHHNKEIRIRRTDMTDLAGNQLVGSAAAEVGIYDKIITLAEIKAEVEQVRLEDMKQYSDLLNSDRRFTLAIVP